MCSQQLVEIHQERILVALPCPWHLLLTQVAVAKWVAFVTGQLIIGGVM